MSCSCLAQWVRPRFSTPCLTAARRITRIGWPALILAMTLSSAAHGQGGAPQIPGKTLTRPPVIDGVIDETEWKEAASFAGLRDADTNQVVAEGGRFWLAYDARYVYFAARLTDPHPEAIHATEYQTNVDLSGDDSVRLSLDLSGSLSDFNDFEINPRGATNVRLAGGRAAKREWSGEFVARARITAQGWEAEAHIPWQIMNLPGAGSREIRFNVSRYVPRTQRRSVFGYTGGGRLAETPRWTGVLLPAPSGARTLHLLPYTFGGVDAAGGGLARSGLDLKGQLAENVALVGTVHPDFRNIENQILSLDFSRFERLAGETRPFFLEGRQYANSALFASQRIQEFDVGLNSYGKINDRTQFGLLDTVSFGDQNALNAVVSYDPDPNDSLRLAVTSLSARHSASAAGAGALDNEAYLIRYARQLGALNIFLRNMGSHDSRLGGGQDDYASLDYSKAGLDLFADYTRSSPRFLPRLGFFPEHDYQGPTGGVFYSHPYAKGTLLEYDLNLFGVDYRRTNGDAYRTDRDLNAALKFREGTALFIDVDRARFEGVNDHLTTLRVARPNGDPYRRQTIEYAWGRLAGLGYRSFKLGSATRPQRGLQLTLTYQLVEHGGQQQQAIFGANDDLGRNYAITGRIVFTRSAGTRSGHTGGYLAFRRSGNRGTEYYLILGDPNAPRFHASFLLKVVTPFDVGL